MSLLPAATEIVTGFDSWGYTFTTLFEIRFGRLALYIDVGVTLNCHVLNVN